MKKSNKYHIKLKQVSVLKEELKSEKTIEFDFDNHDEIFSVLEKVKEKNLFNNDNQSLEFALGLKLFSEVMIKNRENPIFEELFPAFGSFMKKLKSS